MLLVHCSILSRGNGLTRYRRLPSERVENICHSISVSVPRSGRNSTVVPSFKVKVFSYSLGYWANGKHRFQYSLLYIAFFNVVVEGCFQSSSYYGFGS
jgi:hypothetical protein